MVRVQRRIIAKAYHVAAALRIVTQHVVDLPDGKIVVAAALVSHRVAVDKREKRGVGRIPQRAPGVEEGQTAGGVLDSSTGVAHRPVIEPALGVGLVESLARHLRQQHSAAVGLIVPGLRPLQLLAGQARGVDRLRLGEIGLFAGGLVEPCRSPGQFVVVATERVVVGRGVGDAVGILPAVGIGKRVEFAGMLQKQIGIRNVCRTEHDRGCGQCRRRLARRVGARMGGIELVGRPAHCHHFGCTPERMVGTAVADLCVEHVGRGMCLDEPVGAPFQSVEHLRQQPAGGIGIPILHDAEPEHRHGRGHRQGKLHMIAGIVIAAAEIHAHIGAIGQRRVAPPVERERRRQVTRPLRIVEQQRLLQHIGVVVGAGLHGIVIDDCAGAGACEDRGRQSRAEFHNERLVRFDCRVTSDVHGDRFGEFAGSKSKRPAGGSVIAASRRGAIGRRILHRHRLR